MRLFTFISGTLIAALATLPAHSATRSFFEPTVGGDRLSFCLGSREICGRTVADGWCRAMGFDEAMNFQRDSGKAGKVGEARYADTGDMCQGEQCVSFKRIKCWSAQGR